MVLVLAALPVLRAEGSPESPATSHNSGEQSQGVSLAADLSAPPSLVNLRPLTGDDPSSHPVSAPVAAAEGSSGIGPLPVPHTDSEPSEAASTSDTSTATDVAANNATVRASDSAFPPITAEPSPNATINLINLMVKRNLISREDADGLIRQAQEEADVARAQTATTQATAERALATQQAQPASDPAPAASGDEVRVAYVPDVVKKQITDQVTQNVMEQTREESLAETVAASQVPDWVKHFHVSGDSRLRYEGDFYPEGSSVGSFTNFNSINAGSGFVIGATQFPQYNVNQDRDRFRLRARIGAEIDLGQGFTAGLRLGTGADDSPVTENQTLGAANSGQGGDFSKYSIWLDRGFIRYDVGEQAGKDLSFTVGRFDNPFFHTSMIWSDDVAFDGAVVQAKYKVADGVTPFFVAGGFPVFNTDLNFSSDQSAKFSSEDKYLLASQLGTNWTINKDFSAKVAGAYYYFADIEGKVSDPITSDALPGDTDDSRPSFAQNGNTYIELRDYQDPTNPTHAGETQYFGLATPFHELALTSQLDFSGFDPFHVWVTGEFVKNLAFDRNAILNNGSPNLPGPVNNLDNPSDPNSFVGGDIGYLVRLNLGKVVLEQPWDWNVNLSYRYVESDATVDGFTDSDFGGSLAGTNLKGYVLGGNLALSPRVWASLRWMSADAVAGPTYKSDLIQVDLNAKF